MVVTGDNASGKSLYARVAAAIAQDHGAVPVSVSIRERSGAGLDEMARMRQVVMFGDEQENSTGANSVHAVSTAFRNLDRENGSLLILDEPEMGLSESYARALGRYIGEQARAVPDCCWGVIVISHSRPLVRGLMDGFGGLPTHVAVSGDRPASAGLSDWLNASEQRSVDEQLALRDIGHDRWRKVSRILTDP